MLGRYSIDSLSWLLFLGCMSTATAEVHLVADSETSAENSADTYRVKPNPAVRNYLRSRIDYLLSPDVPLNADGLKIDFIDRQQLAKEAYQFVKCSSA